MVQREIPKSKDADAQDNTYTLLQADAGENIRAVVYYIVAGNTDQDTADKTTDYPVLAARDWG